MDVKRFSRLTQLRYMGFTLLPLIFGMVYSFYKFDMIHFWLMILLVPAVVLTMMGLNLLKELNIYRYTEDEEALQETRIVRWEINLDKLRQWMWIFFVISFILIAIISVVTTWRIFIVYLCCFIIGVLFVSGKTALVNTPLNELILSLAIGFVFPLLSVYTNVFFEQQSLFELSMEVLLVSLPLVLSLMILFIGYYLCFHDAEDKKTMTHLMSRGVAEGMMELFLFLAYVLPLFSLYLDYTPWTFLIAWVIFPKLWMDLKKFENAKNKEDYFPYIREIASVTMEFQILIYMLGLFF